MLIDIIMPQLGESVVEGTIGKWLKNEGDWVDKDESIVEVVTEKVAMELPSPATGVLHKILVKEGEKVEVGGVIGKIETKEETEVVEKKEEKPEVKKEVEKEIPLRIKGRKRASPLVRRIAKEKEIDIEEIKGTGIDGRVTKMDILSFIEKGEVKPIQLVKELKEEPKELKQGEELIPLTMMRRAIAEHMVKSIHISPHVTSVIEVDMTDIVKFREGVKDEVRKDKGVNLTYISFIIGAVVDSIKKFPILNSSWSNNGIIIKRYINIGIAVALEDGLIVPVIKSADEKSLLGLAKEVEELSKKARENKLSIEDVQNGTFTITNPGSFGTIIGTPIINQPQVAILGVEAIIKRPVVINDAIAIRSMMNLCLSYDHRVLDGAVAARFLSSIKKYLENFKFPEI